MKKILVIFSVLSISLSAAAASTVDCLWYGGEEITSQDRTLPLGNVVRIEKAKVQGKDRVTIFSNKLGNAIRFVALGSFQISGKGFVFTGTDTVSMDPIEIRLNESTLTMQIGPIKTNRSAQSLGESISGKECRQGLYPENMYF